MPRKDDFYYRRIPANFQNSELRYSLTRAQWGVYNDLCDQLYLNRGALPDNPAFLQRLLMAEPADLEAVLSCKHIRRSDGKVVHTVILKDLKDLDAAREWGHEMGVRSAKARAKKPKKERVVERTVERSVELKGQRHVGHPHSLMSEGAPPSPLGAAPLVPMSQADHEAAIKFLNDTRTKREKKAAQEAKDKANTTVPIPPWKGERP